MAETAYLPRIAIRGSESLDSPRHSAVVRVTHWITAASFFALLVSGIAILIAHPRLYWGQTGALGAPHGRSVADIQRGPEAHLPRGRLRTVSADHPHRTGDVSGHRVRGPRTAERVRRSTVGTHDSLLRRCCPGSVFLRAPRNGLPGRFHWPRAGHDYGLQSCQNGALLTERLSRR